MSEDTVVRMRMLGPTDTPKVSTVLEEMFQWFDGSIRRHTTINKQIRLRLALLVLGDSGYARLDTIMKSMPMVVPTAKLLRLLKLTSLTTDLEPLTLLRDRLDISQQEARHRLQYTRAFGSAMANQKHSFLEVPAATLNMWERGLLHHSRASNGHLVWAHIENSGKGQHLRAGASEANSAVLPAINNSVEIDFEMDSENTLLLREDQLPVPRELLKALEISHKELQALFKTAAKLLAQTNPNDRMRAYATQDLQRKMAGGVIASLM